jgi:hypothetical protein
MADRYARLKRQRQRERDLNKLADFTLKAGQLARELKEHHGIDLFDPKTFGESSMNYVLVEIFYDFKATNGDYFIMSEDAYPPPDAVAGNIIHVAESVEAVRDWAELNLPDDHVEVEQEDE